MKCVAGTFFFVRSVIRRDRHLLRDGIHWFGFCVLMGNLVGLSSMSGMF